MKSVRVATVLFLGAAIVVVFVAIAGGWASWESLRDEAAGFAWGARPLPLLTALAAGVCALFLSGRAWAVLFHAAGGTSSTSESIAAWIGSTFGRYLPGNNSQLTGITAHLRAREGSGAAGFTSSLAWQAVVLVTGAGVGVALAGGGIVARLDPMVAMVGGAGLLLLLHPFVLGPFMRFGAKLLGEDAPSPPRTRTLAVAGLLAIVVWFLYGTGLRATVMGLAPGVGISFCDATAVFAGAYLAGYLVLIAPGGLVVREGTMAILLVAATGVEPGVAVSLAVAARLWTTVAEVVAFGLVGAMRRMHGTPAD